MVAKGREGKREPDPVRCPLCGRRVEAPGEPAAALNRHFGTDCTWRHTSPSPARKK